NAIKFTAKGRVLLHVTDEPLGLKSRFVIRVEDTGVGIPKEDIGRIFQQYEQAGGVSKEPGTGLGLHIVNMLVAKMGGTVLVDSEVGKGSVFTLNLKFETVHTAMPDAGKPADHMETYPRKVWIVDDDPLILEWCRAVLQKNGINHRCFSGPHEVLDTAWEREVGVILVDIRMPVMDGSTLCRRLREYIPAEVKIFALTAQALPEEQGSVLEEGFDGILMKPFREADLLKLLARAAAPSASSAAPPASVTAP